MFRIGLGLQITDSAMGMAYLISLPPDFSDDLTSPSTLLSYWDGSNSSPTTKRDRLNGYDMVAVEGPCLTLEVGDSIGMPGHGALVSSQGTAVLAYDDLDLLVTTAGTLFDLQFSDGTWWPLSEGAGNDGTNVTVHSTTGDLGLIVVAAGAVAAWATTQDELFDAMLRGWWETEPSDGIQYPYDISAGGTAVLNRPNTFNGSNNKYKYPAVQALIDADLTQNAGAEYMFNSGVPVAKSEADWETEELVNNNHKLHGSLTKGLGQYSDALVIDQDSEVRTFFETAQLLTDANLDTLTDGTYSLVTTTTI